VHTHGHRDVDFKCVATSTGPVEHKDEGLPGSTGPSSEFVSSKVIKLANVKLANVTPHNNRTRPTHAKASPKIPRWQAGFRTQCDSY